MSHRYYQRFVLPVKFIRPEVIRYSDMNAIVKAERAKIEKFRERDHQHYQESVDELHTHYKEQMDNIQDEAKKQIKDIEGKYMEAFEDRMSEGNGLFSLCSTPLFNGIGAKEICTINLTSPCTFTSL